MGHGGREEGKGAGCKERRAIRNKGREKREGTAEINGKGMRGARRGR